MDYVYNFLDLVSVILVLVLWFITLKNFGKLPELIPTHFDPDNQPDAIGSKKLIFMYSVLGTVFLIGFFFLNRDPEGFNYAVEITAENKDRQFTVALIAMRLLLIIVLLVFLNLLDFTIRRSQDEKAKPVATFATMILTVISTTGIMIAVSSILK